MDGRQARGRVLAQAQGDRIKCIEGNVWYVPSSTGTGGYLVTDERCSCPDGAAQCKHTIAVEIVRGALVKASAPALAPAAPAPAPVKAPPKPPKGDLTEEEEARVRAALRYVARGGWDALAKGTRYTVKSLKHAAYERAPSASLAVRLARYAGVGVDELLGGKYPPSCPHCGQTLPLRQI